MTLRASNLAPMLLVMALVCGSTWSASALFVPNTVLIPSLKNRKKPGRVTYSHWNHSQFSCYVCHPSLFPMERQGFDHDAMKNGRYCGACHDGESAFAHRSRCTQCHESKKAD